MVTSRIVGVLALSGWLAAGLCCAQNYPSRPIRLISPFAAGGGNDILARIRQSHSGKRGAGRQDRRKQKLTHYSP